MKKLISAFILTLLIACSNNLVGSKQITYPYYIGSWRMDNTKHATWVGQNHPMVAYGTNDTTVVTSITNQHVTMILNNNHSHGIKDTLLFTYSEPMNVIIPDTMQILAIMDSTNNKNKTMKIGETGLITSDSITYFVGFNYYPSHIDTTNTSILLEIKDVHKNKIVQALKVNIQSGLNEVGAALTGLPKVK